MLTITRFEKQDLEILERDGRKWINIDESITIDGVEYSRSGYMINGKTRADQSQDHFRSEDGICRCGQCGSDSFRVKVVSYSCEAICTQCGFSSVVCDG